MKFIGQYIHDLIARFRSDVYLEDVSSGTIASGGNLGLDSNNKIVKANEPTSHDAVTLAGTPDYITLSGQEITRNAIDLAADVTGTLPVSNGGTGVTSLGSIDISSFNNDSGFTANTGDITGITVSDGATSHTTSSGTHTTQFLTGEGIDVTINSLSGTVKQVTYSAEDASTSNKGVASFSSDNFAASSGAISIKSGGVDLTDEVTGTLPVGNGGTGATTLTSNSILTGNGTSAVQAESTLSYDSEILDIGADDNSAATIRRLRHTDEAGGDLYIRSGDATGTNKAGGDLQIFGGRATGNAAGGAVIIQAGETNASSGTTLRGTNVIASFRTDGDTLLQGNLIFEGSVPDAHETTFSVTNPTADRTITVPDSSGTMALTGVNYTYQYISFTGNSTVPSDGDWITVSANGISNHSWNVNLGSGGTSVDSSTVTIPTGNICQGIIVPYDCVLVGYSSLIRSVGNHQSKVGLAVGVPTYNDFATFDCTLRAYNAADISAGPDTNYSQRPVRADNLSVNYSMSAGHVIFPLIGSVASNSRTVQWNCTLVLKTLLP